MVLLIILIMIGASILVLSLSLGNILYAEQSISLSRHSYEAVSEITTIRLLTRSLTELYQGYLINRTPLIANRIQIYEQMIHTLNDMLLFDANQLEDLSQFLERDEPIECGFLS